MEPILQIKTRELYEPSYQSDVSLSCGGRCVPRLRSRIAHAGGICAAKTSALVVARLADLEALAVALATPALSAVAPAHFRGVLRPRIGAASLMRADVVAAVFALAVRRARHPRGEAHAEALQAARAVAPAAGRLAALDAAVDDDARDVVAQQSVRCLEHGKRRVVGPRLQHGRG